MNRIAILAAIVPMLVGACGNSGSDDAESDRLEQAVHEVTAIAIVQKFGYGTIKKRFVLQANPSISIFVQGEDDDKGIDELQALLAAVEEIGPELAAKFIAANRQPRQFHAESFPSEFSVRLLSDEKKEALFSGGTEEGWGRFYGEFESFGMVSASRPVFSADGQSALIMIWHQSGPLQGMGGFVMAKRLGDSWITYDLTSAPFGVS